MQNIDPITIIIFIPLCDRYLYPTLRKAGIKFKPITRIFWGFMMATIAMAYAAYVQNRIYTAGPCYTHPLQCEAAKVHNSKTGETTILHNSVHVALQSPAYFFVALSEIFANITGLEYAYTKSPASMKSFIMSLFLLTNAGGALMGIALAPIAKDPYLTYLYTGLAGLALVGGCVFWAMFSKYNRLEDAMNEMQATGGASGAFDPRKTDSPDGGMSVGAGEVPAALPMTYQLSNLDGNGKARPA
jgi:POT family proton-dependent oligopeptide transporter